MFQKIRPSGEIRFPEARLCVIARDLDIILLSTALIGIMMTVSIPHPDVYTAGYLLPKILIAVVVIYILVKLVQLFRFWVLFIYPFVFWSLLIYIISSVFLIGRDRFPHCQV